MFNTSLYGARQAADGQRQTPAGECTATFARPFGVATGVGFRWGALDFPLLPTTAFYEWLYVSAIYPHRAYLQRLHAYAGFTDIEFNPEKSLNCQAHACATFVALDKRGLLDASMQSPAAFIAALHADAYRQPHAVAPSQHSLFSLAV